MSVSSCPTFDVFHVFVCIAAFGLVAVNNCLAARMWGKKASVPLHALHLGFGIGALLAQQVCRPFISERLPGFDDDVTTGGVNTTTSTPVEFGNSSVNSSVAEFESSQFHIPYMISCAITFSLALMCLFFYFFEKFHGLDLTSADDKSECDSDNAEEIELKANGKEFEKHNTNENRASRARSLLGVFNPGSCADGDSVFGFIMMLLVLVYYMNVVGAERIYSKFLYSYSRQSKNRLSKDRATLVNSLFWIFFTFGRLLAVVLAKFVPVKLYIIANILFNVIAGFVLSVFANGNAPVLYACSALMGLVLSPLFPNLLAWVNQYLKLKGVAVACVFIGSSCGGLIYQWVGGFLFEYYGPQTIMYNMLFCAVLLGLVFMVLLLLTRNRPTRFNTAKSPSKQTHLDSELSGNN